MAHEKAFKPYVAPNTRMREFTLRATILGLIFGFFFAVANAYLALKVGTTISASIPAAIMSMALLKLLFRDATILENNIVQTISTVGEGLAGGVVFTIPALILLGDPPPVGRIFLLAALGGILGVLFMIPMRRFVIVEGHGKLPYPEGTACAEILKAASSKSALMASFGILAAALYKICSNALFLWRETLAWTFPFFKRTGFSIDVTPALLGVGYIVGSRISSVMFAGGALAWWVLIPMIEIFGLGQQPIYPSSAPISEMSAEAVWSSYVRYIGAGTLAVGGFASLIGIIPLLWRILKESFKELFRGFRGRAGLVRTEKDIPMSWLILGSLAIILLLWLFPGLPMNFLTIVLLAVLSFLFTAVTSITVGLVGTSSNPVSGMTILTLLVACFAFVLLGWTEKIYLIAAITMGCVACCAITLAGTTAQDLKTGFLLGATPRSQQLAEILGVFIPALALGYTVYLLNSAYKIGSPLMPAPQATLVSLIADAVLKGNLPYVLFGIGVVIGLIVAIFRIPILPFALGVYLPLSLVTAMMAGGLVRAYVDKKSDLQQVRERGILLASGLVGGDACVGIVIALLTVANLLPPSESPVFPNWVGLLCFLLLGCGVAFFSLREAKKRG